MSSAFRDGLRKAIIGLVHLWYFSNRTDDALASTGSLASTGNWIQMIVYADDLGLEHLGTADTPPSPIGGRDKRIVVTIEMENYTP